MAETTYGTAPEDSHVMSERVQALASSIYQEFERMMKRYDEDVVKELMPLVVGILENLDQAHQEKQENDVELELLRDDNEQLLTQYEREKQLRKASEQKCLEVEDVLDEERKELQGKVESLESVVRMMELKGKNAQDHIMRLEDKESDMKKEYNKLHERYTDLFKTHMDYMERTKLVMGSDKIVEMSASPRTRGGFHMPQLKPVNPGLYQSGETPVTPEGGYPGDMNDITSPTKSNDSNVSLKHELKDIETAEKEQNTEVYVTTKGTATKNSNVGNVESAPSEGDKDSPTKSTNSTVENVTNSEIESTLEPYLTGQTNLEHEELGCDTIESERRQGTEGESNQPSDGKATKRDLPELQISEIGGDVSFEDDQFGDMMQSPESEDGNFLPNKSTPLDASKRKPADGSSIFDELGMQEVAAVDDGVDITGMGKEVENLILENTELLATKNALNIVKDDLIVKVDELTSEQEILKEEISSLQTVREKLKQRVTELEADLKKSREDLEKIKEKQASGQEGEETVEGEVPMAQRKRFTRVEMARVLMERNQYKERLMELQEAVRWTEMIRASKEHPDVVPASKKKGSIWNLFNGNTDIVESVNEQISSISWPKSFSNLFSSDKPKSKKAVQSPTLFYTSGTSVRPVGDPNKRQRDNYNMGEKSRAYDFLQDDLLTEKARKEREKERREQYKQVRAHVKKDDGRMQAYGWSLPTKFSSPQTKQGQTNKNKVPVPVPVYCRPLVEMDDNLKIWCAAGVNLAGGKTKDGGSIVGASVFYNDAQISVENKEANSEIEKLNKELEEHEKDVKATETEQDKMTSVIWICTTTHNQSQVTVVNANNPGDVIETFRVSTSHVLCIASVPGSLESDFPADDTDIECSNTSTDGKKVPSATASPRASPARHPDNKTGPSGDTRPDNSEDTGRRDDNAATQLANNGEQGIGGITFVQCVTGSASPQVEAPSKVSADGEGNDTNGNDGAPSTSRNQPSTDPTEEPLDDSQKPYEFDDHYFEDPLGVSPELETLTVTKARGSPVKSSGGTPTHSEGEASTQDLLVKDGVSDVGLNMMSDEMNKLSSLLPTMWIGTQSGSLYVHSAVSNWKRCLHSVKLKDSILSIVHVKGRVFVALADGTVAMFRRNKEGQWDLSNYYLIDLGKPANAVRCLCVVANKHLWCGYKNKIHVINPKTLKLEKSFDAHPRKESQVRQLAWTGDGVWVSIRLDSTLRLYHAYTHQHLQDVDIEPYVSKMLGTGKLGFSFIRITSLLISSNRLWIGTGNGVIISVPLSDSNKMSMTTSKSGRPGGVVRVYETQSDSVTPASFIPYVSMAQAQLSFHGHRDAVKFFVGVPGAPNDSVSGVVAKNDNDKIDSPANRNMLVVSGGEGYIDFRLGDPEDESDTCQEDGHTTAEKKVSISKGDRSHLIVWQVFNNK